MMCKRCQGLMVSVTLEDSEGTVMREPTVGWRCLLCGEVVDPTITDNRNAPLKPPHRKPTPRLNAVLGEGHRGGRDHGG